MCEEDLKGMYKSLKSGYVLLRCDVCTPTTESETQKCTLEDVISSATTTFTKALKPQVSVSAATLINLTSPPNIPSIRVGISLARSTKLQSKKLQEFRELQQQLDSIIVDEFTEQKAIAKLVCA